MSVSCVICKKSGQDSPELSFHRVHEEASTPSEVKQDSSISDTRSSTTLTASETDLSFTENVPTEASFVVHPTKRKIRYVGDLDSEDFATPRRRRKSLNMVKTTLAKSRKQVRLLRNNLRYCKRRIKTLENLLQHLKRNSYISEGSEDHIKASLPVPAKELLERMICKKNVKYTDSLRSFALTLSFYSPRAFTHYHI
ncbi:hypothetical protein HUJ05_006751 [Dendroctonus ponderosae]|nr:hypothetical protein HUJ05_006751 [Dendroctonus ponderosae]